MKVNIKITFLFPTSLLSHSQLSSVFSLLSPLSLLCSLFFLCPVPCDCSWWFRGCASVVHGSNLVGEVIRHDGNVGLIWWVSVT